MCGIAGWLSPAGQVDRARLDAVRERLVHRGPDGAGTWLSNDRRVGLAHRRLSIIDLSAAADQPMHVDGRASIVFNGEIYNHAALRVELEREGVRFVTDHADTEVLLRGYLHWGLAALLERLVGMFAFALHDHREGRVHLVRDRVGVKPLYYAQLGDDLLFASESKALFAHPRLDAQLDHESFRHYLSFRAVPAPRTLFAGVRCLGAGERLEYEVDSGRLTRSQWWDPLANREEPPPTLEDARDRLAELLGASVESRLVADVPVGLFLSGGVDSAYLLRRMSRAGSDLTTFTVTYPGHQAYDEGTDARALAAASGSRHVEVPLDAEQYAAAQAAVAWHQDEPIAAPVCTSVYALAQAARREDVPVVLSGEGADELFLGYPNWLRLRDAETWNRRLPDLPGRLLRRGAAAIGARTLDWLSPYPELLDRAAAGRPLFWGGSTDFGERAKRALIGPSVQGSTQDTYDAVIAPLRADFLKRGDAHDVAAWMSYVDLRFRLPQLMLPRVDKMGMAASVEGRVPFLDHRVIEFVLGLPAAWRGGAGDEPKALFKAVAERELPRAFVRRQKRGFQAPVKEWKQGALGERYLPALRTFADRTGLFATDALEALTRATNDRLYFSLTNFMLWHLLYVEDVLDGALPEVQAVLDASRTQERTAA